MKFLLRLFTANPEKACRTLLRETEMELVSAAHAQECIDARVQQLRNTRQRLRRELGHE